MIILNSTTPAHAGERSRLPNRPQSGPVTLAIRAMRQTEAASWQTRQEQIFAEEHAALRALKQRIGGGA